MFVHPGNDLENRLFSFSGEIGLSSLFGTAKAWESAQVAGCPIRTGIWTAPHSKPRSLFFSRSTIVGTSPNAVDVHGRLAGGEKSDRAS